jgi:hypothetical protein
MMPFLNPTLPSKMQKTHFNCSNWGVLELPFEEEELLGAKNAQMVALRLLAFQNSLCLANTSHCCFQSMALEFAPMIMLITNSLMNADSQKSPSNFGSTG